MARGSQPNIPVTVEQMHYIANLWPENFTSLFDMGQKAFERLFNHREHLKLYFSTSGKDEDWKKSETLKKIVLSLEQILTNAVVAFGEEDPEQKSRIEAFEDHMQQLGGLHRAIAPSISPDNFELLFKLLPEVIADVVSRRTEGPLTPDERRHLLEAWGVITSLMIRHFVSGWERRVIPKDPKLAKAYRSEQSKEGEHGKSQRNSTGSGPPSTTNSRKSSTIAAVPTPVRRVPETSAVTTRHRPNRSRTQDEMIPWHLERGHSEPLALHDLTFELNSPES